jgi:hypothetical protein
MRQLICRLAPFVLLVSAAGCGSTQPPVEPPHTSAAVKDDSEYERLCVGAAAGRDAEADAVSSRVDGARPSERDATLSHRLTGISITAAAGKAGTDLLLSATKPEDVHEVRTRTHAALAK